MAGELFFPCKPVLQMILTSCCRLHSVFGTADCCKSHVEGLLLHWKVGGGVWLQVGGES
jgi:hypothetical protein